MNFYRNWNWQTSFLKFQLDSMSNSWDIWSKCILWLAHPEHLFYIIDVLYFFSPFCLAISEIIGSKFVTDGQTDRQILWQHIGGYVDFFFQLNLLLPYSLCSQGDNKILLKSIFSWELKWFNNVLKTLV